MQYKRSLGDSVSVGTIFSPGIRYFLIGSILFLMLLVMAGALSIPFLFESPSMWYKIGIDKGLLRAGKMVGIGAGLLLLLQLPLAGRLKWLDRLFSMPGNDDSVESRPEDPRIYCTFNFHGSVWFLGNSFENHFNRTESRRSSAIPVTTQWRPIMKKIIKHLVLLISALFILSHAHASAPEWNVDFDHTGLYFSINHIYSVVRGHFDQFEGTVMFTPDDLANSRFDFEVETKSINTNNSKRDRHLNSADFFDSKKYPTMAFKSRSVKHVNGNQYTVDGTLTIKDVSKEVSVLFTFLGKKDFPFDKKQDVAGFEARMTIDRLAYNVGSGKYVEMGVVGQEVEVLISMEVLRKK